jgi:hypothetical protein
MHVDFWFDPACPFCWQTSRWLVRVATVREIDITWQPISLFFKNDLENHPESPYYAAVSHTRDLLRVVESVRAAGGEDSIGDLYTEFGRQIHHLNEPQFDVAEALTKVGLDPSHAAALEDASFDADILRRQGLGLELVGDDVGTPIIAVDGAAGRVGLFGPVITEVLDMDASLRLWDGFLAMVDTPGFFELKRTRTEHPVFSPDDPV